MAGLRFGSVCSGIEAASVAWEPLGFTPAWFAEIEAFPNAVLAHHWPHIPNLGDITSADFIERAGRLGHIDILVGGTPCQGFSHAGRRKGIKDPRSALAMRFIETARTLRPEWVVWENVPGCLTTAGGRDFGAFVGQVAECGYRWAYRVCDAQFFGVPQRRRRVFLVGHLGAGRPEKVLFEPEGEGRNPAAGGEAGAATPRTTGAGAGGMRVFSNSGTCCWSESVGTMRARDHKDGEGQGLIVHGSAIALGNDSRAAHDAVSQPLRAGTADLLAFSCKDSGADAGTLAPTLRAMGHSGSHANAGGQVAVAGSDLIVRRLTPLECERLMGFPDNHTLVTYRKKPAADGPRYKALGNSIAIPVLRWIGSRLLAESNTERLPAEVA